MESGWSLGPRLPTPRGRSTSKQRRGGPGSGRWERTRWVLECPCPGGGGRLVAGAGGLPETTAQRRRQGWARPGVGSRPPHPPSTSFLFLWGYRKERGCRGEGGQQPRTPEALEQRLFPSTADEASSGCRVGGPRPQRSTSTMGPCRRAAEGPAARQREDTLRDGLATMWPRWPGAASLLGPSGPLRGPRSS